MKAMKKAVSLLLCVVMTIGIFAASGITVDDLAGLFTLRAEAYTNTTIGRITQEQVVGNTTSIDGIPARDFWYSVLAQDYFNGHSEPTNMVIPGLGKNSDYTPQGMTYWEAKNWILMSAYDASSAGRATCIYAIDVASGKFVALFNIYNADGSVNTSHGGGIAASEHNFYFADSGSNISYIPLSDLAKVEQDADKEIDITIKGTVSFAGELNNASTSYCCYDEGVLWVGNFFYTGDGRYTQPANSAYNSMLLGYKLNGDTSQEEWDYLCGKYENVINVTTASGTGSNSGSTLKWNAYKNGESVDITGSITAPTAYVGEYCPNFGSLSLNEGKDYIIEFISTNNNSDLYIFSPGGKHTNVKQSSQTTITQLEDGRYHYRMFFTAGLKPTGADSSWPTTQSTDGSFTGTYTMRFDQDAIQAGEARDFAMTDIRVTEANPNLLKLMHTSVNNANFNYTITTNANGSYNISGTAINSGTAAAERTSNYATVDLVEGETYTLEFISTDQLTDAYIFAPSGANGTHMRLFAQRGTALGDGTYKYSTTFTAGKNLKSTSGGDYTWPVEQSTNGGFTGTYTLRFDQDSVPANSSRTFTISNITLKKTDSSRPSDRIHFVGTAGYPTYVVAIPNTANLNFYGMDFIDTSRETQMTQNVTMDKIQYAMVDNGRIYLSRSWSRKIDVGSSYLSEIDIIDIDLNVPGNGALTINGNTRTDCYLIDSKVDGINDIYGFYNLSMGEALCVVDDYLYIFTESAAYNYRMKEYDNEGKDLYEADKTISSQPVDVVWKIDQYALMGEDRPTAGEEPVETWEKVNSLDEINYTDEYMIVYESDMRDPATGQKIMYALDADGGFKDGLVPKYKAGSAEQKDTADSLGIVGHPISRYTVEGDIMTLYSPDADDKASLRWKIIGADTGSMRLESQDTYYGHSKNLYIGSRLMYMSTSEGTDGLDNVSVEELGNGKFRFYYNGGNKYYLWCNDGSNDAYMDAYTSQYSSTYAFEAPVKAYAGQVEQAGTFHSDAEHLRLETDGTDPNSGNRTGVPVDIKYQAMSIYRRASDVTSTSGESGLYTDLNAELQSDGTYTLTLESYTTGQTVTKTSTDGKPIDFVFVLDTSASMTNNNDFKFWGINDNPERYSRDLFKKSDYNRKRALKYGDVYYDVWGESETQDSNNMYAIDIKNDRTTPYSSDYFFVGPNGEFYAQGGSSNKQMCNSYGLWKNEASDESFMGGFYHAERTTDRFTAMKMSTIEFIEQIAAHAEATGIQHRISIIQYGSSSGEGYHNTGMYSTTNGTSMVSYSTLVGDVYNDNYKKAFFPATHDSLITIVENLSTANSSSGQDADTYVNHGFDMATWALAMQIKEYNGPRDYGDYNEAASAGSNASACIVTITDGVPGVGNDATIANNVANEAIASANVLKDYDVAVHALKMGSPSLSGFDIDSYMNRLSSNYNSSGTSVASKYYTTIGLSAVREGGTGMTGIFGDMFTSMGKEVIDTGTDITLNASSILQENISDHFLLTNATANVKTASIYYDALGRIYEEAPVAASYSTSINKTAGTVQVTGFDYSSLYVASGNNSGKKLYLTIDGVLLNPSNIQNSVEVNKDATTAIYQTSNDITNNNPFQGFPQANVDIPEVNHVVDFGINMVSSNLTGTPLSIDTVPDKQSTYTTSLSNNNTAVKIASGALNMSVEPDCNSATSAYALMQRPLGGYYWAKVNVVPASNVLFEETSMNITASTNVDWSTASAGTVNPSQTVSSSSDIYGYDSKYSGGNGSFSNGTAYTSTVTNSNKRSDTVTFNFTGTGFDLISACGTNTGIQTVTVKQGTTIKKVLIVDTYYNDTAYGMLRQVPIASYTGDYGTYTVETTAVYLSSAQGIKTQSLETAAVDGTEIEAKSAEIDALTAEEILAQVGMEDLAGADVELVWMDDNSVLNGGTGAANGGLSTQATGGTAASLVNYIDGFRIYNPVPTSSQSGYLATEADAEYYNVINSLASSSDIISGNGATSFIGYVEKILGGSINFSDYSKSNAPKNEIYLTNNGDSALTFKVKLNNSSSRVMLAMRAAYGTPAVVINGNAIKVNGSDISSATEMYYDITEALKDSISNNYATITIKNTSANSILAINNVKIVNGSLATMATEDLPQVAMLMTMSVTPLEVNTPKVEVSENAYPNYVPDTPVANADPDLDLKGEYVIIYPKDSTNDNGADSSAAIIEFFNNLIDNVVSFFKRIVEILTSLISKV